MSAWITWKGGDCPVTADTTVEVRFRDHSTACGKVWSEKCADFWNHTRPPEDHIIAYRVVQS